MKKTKEKCRKTFVSYIQYCGKIRGGDYSHMQVWIMIVTDLCDMYAEVVIIVQPDKYII